LAWALLNGDVIENLGRVEPKGEPIEDLANRIAECIPYPLHQINDNLRSWVSQGLLKYNPDGGHLVWQWS
ncbi:MAG: hypothetical protein V3S51_04415, partial [Dehalococcoidia bacterium]